jgi:hypothetical protein
VEYFGDPERRALKLQRFRSHCGVTYDAHGYAIQCSEASLRRAFSAASLVG